MTFNRKCLAEGTLSIVGKSQPKARLLSMDGTFSIQKECERFGYHSSARHIMGAVLVAFSLMIFWTVAPEPVTKIKMAWSALIRPWGTIEYAKAKDLQENPPAIGRTIHLNGVRVTPVFTSAGSYGDVDGSNAQLGHSAIAGVVAINRDPSWTLPDLSKEKKYADAVMILSDKIASHLVPRINTVMLFERNDLISELKFVCNGMPEQLQCRKLIEFLSCIKADEVLDENGNPAKLTEQKIKDGSPDNHQILVLGNSVIRSLIIEIEHLLAQAAKSPNQRIADALVQQSTQLTAQPVVIIKGPDFINQFNVPTISFDDFKDDTTVSIQKVFAQLVKRTAKLKFIRTVDCQSVVLAAKKDSHGHYELTLGRNFTPAEYRMFVFQGTALAICIVLLVIMATDIYIAFKRNKKRARQIQQFYQKN